MKRLRNRLLFCTLMVHLHYFSYAQIMTLNGSVFYVNGGTVFCNGGITIENGSSLTNNGLVVTTKNSTFNSPGNFEIASYSTVSGNGGYTVEQDWINDATFNGDNGEVVLNGNLEQFITSNNGTITNFNHLQLTGNGTGINCRKTLVGVDATTSANGYLVLNNRELHTGTNTFTVNNENPIAISNSIVLNDEGFVSSLPNGLLVRKTNQQADYIFPVGSSDGIRRYRPVAIEPNAATATAYAARFNNYQADNDNFNIAQHDESIEFSNKLFYHTIKNLSGNVAADVSIHYIAQDDEEWDGIGHWYVNDSKWKDVVGSTASAQSSFSILTKSAWNFPSSGDAYILTKTANPFSIPNVFTPNEDGINDLFFITAVNLKDYNLVIVNRWGEIVFKSDDPNQGWDGTSGGKKCTDGVYFYTLKAKQGDNEITKQGNITLVGK
ncbi:MAG: gliding motility-associated C-terminal domain-containing protein [Crocinitomicaceae bacterium]|nr:gliding motility-associated C-terminal domain-containing protein [Crocinitomicaceae bacterium]